MIIYYKIFSMFVNRNLLEIKNKNRKLIELQKTTENLFFYIF